VSSRKYFQVLRIAWKGQHAAYAASGGDAVRRNRQPSMVASGGDGVRRCSIVECIGKLIGGWIGSAGHKVAPGVDAACV
jgi:hypothetical protein